MRHRAARAGSCIALGLALGSCGAKTGLLVPDAAVDVAPDVRPDVVALDVPVVCVPGTVELTPRAADVLLVIDRSGSMAFGLDSAMRPAPGTPSRWTLLGQALGTTLVGFADRIDVGVLFFPQSGSSQAASCALPDVPMVDVEPGPGNAMRVLAAVNTAGPAGSTPTYAALHRAYTWIVRNPNRARARYIVLTTDGAPNCNPGLDPNTCTCTSGTGTAGMGCGPRGSPNACLDDTRTIDVIREIARNPATAVPTYVVGIAPDADPVLSGTLTQMALAGGRPKILPNGTRTFYSVRQPGDFAAAITEIQSSIARCAFVTPSRPDDPDGLRITLDGVAIPRDTSRNDGWDWTDEGFGELTLFGPACERVEARNMPLAGTVGCNDR